MTDNAPRAGRTEVHGREVLLLRKCTASEECRGVVSGLGNGEGRSRRKAGSVDAVAEAFGAIVRRHDGELDAGAVGRVDEALDRDGDAIDLVHGVREQGDLVPAALRELVAERRGAGPPLAVEVASPRWRPAPGRRSEGGTTRSTGPTADGSSPWPRRT